MARNLVDGECGGANSLMKLTTHFTQDKAFRQEALGPGFGPQHHAQGARPVGVATPDELVGEFLSGQNVVMAPQTFHMGSLLQEMREIEEAEMAHAPQRGPAIVELAADGGWADEFLAAEQSAPISHDAAWAAEFRGPDGGMISQDMKLAAEYLDQADNHQQIPLASDFERHMLPMGPAMVADQVGETWSKMFDQDLAEGADDSQTLRKTAKELESAITDPKINSSEFMKFVRKIGDGEITIEDNKVVDTAAGQSEDWVSDFQTAEGAKSLTDRWAEEFADITGGRAENDVDFWSKLQEQWQEADSNNHGHPWLTEFEQTSGHEKYTFEEENPLKEHPAAFEEGLKCLEKGDIPNAVLLFEAAVQQKPEHAEAWQYLGMTQAENEQEPSAIAALKKCLDLEPANLKAWQCLAVSYTNESMGSLACHALKAWLQHNPMYTHLLSAESVNKPVTSSFMTSTEYEDIRDLYLKAVQSAAPDDKIDADIQCNLGVLFNLSGEYDKAVDCFQAALQVRPEDALLWNKLGATLANGNRSEEAVDAYHNALQLSPGFIRSRCNLGIACINLGAHKEAMEHFLAALNIQQKSRGPSGTQNQMSQNIWTTLRMTLSLMGRQDLYHHCDALDIDALCAEFGMSS